MNYVLFFADEMRASNLGCYGNPLALTPNYDRLASEGTLFENHYVTNPVCVGSRCSLLTGWYPHVSGHRSLYHFLSPHEPNFLRYLKQSGYNVQLYGKNHVLDKDAMENSVSCYDDCHQLFAATNHFKDVDDFKQYSTRHFFTEDYTMLYPPMDENELAGLMDTCIVERAISFLDEYNDEDEPFFLFIAINHPHAPYVTTKYYDSLYNPDQFTLLKKTLENEPSFMKMLKKYSHFENIADATFRKCAAVYLGMTTYCDDMLGRILDALDRNNLSGNTMVIASADHGDFSGDYGLIEKWPNAFYDNLTKTPLIFRVPGGEQNHRVKELVSEIDIFPTILDYANVEMGHDQFGKSLRAQLNGENGDPHAAVYSEGGYDLREPQCFEGNKHQSSPFMIPNSIYYPKLMVQQKEGTCVCRGTMMRKGDYKLILRTNGENEFFDLAEDSGELVNQYKNSNYAEIIHLMEKEMLLWYIQTSDVVPHLK